jgi:hypothetical protein
MNWDAIGAIAELLGAVGVIASLVYLAGQIRNSRDQMDENTRALRAGTYQQFQVELRESFSMNEPGLESVVRTGLADPGDLDESGAFRFEFWISGVMHAYDNAYYQYRVGLLDEDRWQMHLAGLRTTLTRFPGVRRWWETAEYTLASPDFVALVEGILGDEPSRGE